MDKYVFPRNVYLPRRYSGPNQRPSSSGYGVDGDRFGVIGNAKPAQTQNYPSSTGYNKRPSGPNSYGISGTLNEEETDYPFGDSGPSAESGPSGPNKIASNIQTQKVN